MRDPALNSALRTAGDGSEEVRGKRLGALQAATPKVSAKEELKRVLSFHQRVAEAEAFAQLPGKAGELYAEDDGLYPAESEVWAEWLHGEHKPAHRRRVLGQFAVGASDNGTEAALSLVASVKVLGEGVDTRECDAVVFADVRGSMPDLVQAVGRAAHAPGRRQDRHPGGTGLPRPRRGAGRHAHLPRVQRAGQAAVRAARTRRPHREADRAQHLAHPRSRAPRRNPRLGRGPGPGGRWRESGDGQPAREGPAAVIRPARRAPAGSVHQAVGPQP
ncbi:DEAD/DEAH box helicase family protein [Streptomyces lunaelactis]|uniref:DEAD/DEAH box helicase family protein n=1 Tax=Streptomyces lunaelactis TaxID=1535768 RepID=UPI00281618B2|nr:helicase-related protein [Streptomyces lunaelactis]